MLYFNERTPSLCVLESLPQIFSIEEAETNLFRPTTEIYNDAGCWGRILNRLSSRYSMRGSGRFGDLSWRASSASVGLQHLKWPGRVQRSARTLEIHLGNQTLVAGFIPHVYTLGGMPFADHRFVVGCTDEAIVPLVILFSDVILGDDSWEADLQDTSTNPA